MGPFFRMAFLADLTILRKGGPFLPKEVSCSFASMRIVFHASTTLALLKTALFPSSSSSPPQNVFLSPPFSGGVKPKFPIRAHKNSARKHIEGLVWKEAKGKGDLINRSIHIFPFSSFKAFFSRRISFCISCPSSQYFRAFLRWIKA